MPFSSYVAIGDSFTEGVGDDLPDGTVRGWADLVARGLALASTGTVTYANLAIRGRLLDPIATTQMDAAIALGPALISINGGGNDIMRPRVSIAAVANQLLAAVDSATGAGIHVVLASGANPTRHLPLGASIEKRGDLLALAVRDRLPRDGVTWVDNWADVELAQLRYWSVGLAEYEAMRAALGVPILAPHGDDGDIPRPRTSAYWRTYVLPWIGRRLTGRSSGDNREPKSATLQPVVIA